MAAGDRFIGPYFACGEVVGTGAAITVTLDFKPQAVEMRNQTTKTWSFWQFPQAAAAADKITDSGAGTTDISTISSNGITVGNSGFIIGTDNNNASDVILWKAFR